jgi:hypothetical protein
MSKIKLNISSWKIKKTFRSKGRMKLNIKLGKDEAEGFKNWSDAVRPPDISDEDFLKQIFFNGIEHLNQKLQDMSRKLMADPEMRKNLESSGINVSALENSLTRNLQK